MSTTGVTKPAGTVIKFAKDSEELKKIKKANAGGEAIPLPQDMPGRVHFLKAGLTNLQAVSGLQDWGQVKGIGDKTAKELDEYFQSKNKGE